ncbi:MAG: sulfur reduction protein DsrS, partial [Sedimenticolaceae bacterium]|nr:sulfur reduction protein DsrS [Sedimenticolaceae bacterium]
ATLDNLALYFSGMRPGGRVDMTLAELEQEAESGSIEPSQAVEEVLGQCPDCAGEIRAMHLLSGLGYGVLRPVLRDTTAIGSLMRRKIEPVITPLLERIALLQS